MKIQHKEKLIETLKEGKIRVVLWLDGSWSKVEEKDTISELSKVAIVFVEKSKSPEFTVKMIEKYW